MFTQPFLPYLRDTKRKYFFYFPTTLKTKKYKILMKRLLSLLFFTCATFLAFSQNTINVNGTVTDVNGNTVPDVLMIIEVPANTPMGVGYTSTHLTDNNGNYSDDVPLGNNSTQGMVIVTMYDCDSTTISQTAFWNPNTLSITLDFTYCAGGGGSGNCDVSIAVDSIGGIFGLELTANPTGTPGYIYMWSNGASTQSTIVTQSGTYCVTIVDADGCTATACETISLGNNNCTVAIQTTPMGGLTAVTSGFGNPSFLWNTGQTSQSIFPTESGEYCVTAVDVNGCAATACYFLDIGGGDTLCFVTIELIQGGSWLQAIGEGTAPFSYVWSDGSTGAAIPIAPNSITYCVTMTDATGCVSDACITIGNPNCDVNITIATDSVTNTTTLTANPTGTGPFSYFWPVTGAGLTTQSISVTESGDYCVEVTDEGTGCVATACVYVDLGGGGGDSCGVNIVLVQIFMGTNLEAIPSGTAPYTYLWNTGATTSSIPYTANGSTWCVTITDANNCVATACYPTVNACSVSISQDPNTLGLTAWQIGTGNFSFLWSTGETTQNIFPTSPGTYCVTLTDGNGCVAEDCYELGGTNCSVTISIDSTLLGIDLTANPLGLAPFTYLWNTGATTASIAYLPNGALYCVTITDATGCEASACFPTNNACSVSINQNPNFPGLIAYPSGTGPYIYMWSTGELTQIITPLAPGNYCVTVTDATGCTAEDCYTFGGGPDCSVSISIDSSALGVTLTANGTGVAPFTYFWDMNQTGNQIVVNSSGTYCVTMVDANGCTATSCITVSIGGTPNCSVEIIEVDSAGVDYLIAVPFSSGFALNYSWNNGTNNSYITPIVGGFFCVTITDPSGCTASDCYSYNPGGANGNNGIFGIANFLDSTINSNISGSASLYLFDALTGSPDLVETVSIQSSPNGAWYDFGNVDNGDYLVKLTVDPNSPFFDDYLPTYYGDVLQWQDADIINIPYMGFQSFDITFIDGGVPPGNGNIGGTVDDGEGLVGQNNDDRSGGLAGISILLFDENEEPIGHAVTDESGNFNFEDLAWGTYKVWIEIVGQDQAWHWVTIGPDNPSVTNIVFEVTEEGVSVTTSIEEIISTMTFETFPNPVNDILNVSFEMMEREAINISLSSMTGQTVITQSQTFTNGKQNVQMNLSDLPQGVYILSISNNKEAISKKVVKQ